MKILIAHSSTSYIDATREFLNARGEEYQAQGVSTFQECLDQAIQYDVLLLDSDLFKYDVESALKRLSQLARHVPIVVMMEDNETDLAIKLKNAGVFSGIFKRKGYLSFLPAHFNEAYKYKQTKLIPAVKPSPVATPAAVIEPQRTMVEPMRSRSAEEGYFICDRRGRFLSASRPVYGLVKYTEDEILELSISDLLSNDDESMLFHAIVEPAEGSNLPIPLTVEMVDKTGDKHPVELKLKVLYDESTGKQIIGFRGVLCPLVEEKADRPALPAEDRVDQQLMVNHLVEVVQLGYQEPIHLLLKRIAEVAGEVFRFRKSTLALLDRRRKAYIKHAMVGYTALEAQGGEKRVEVPADVIDHLFSDHGKIKVIYHDQEDLELRELAGSDLIERREQRRPLETKWHKRDLVLLKLADYKGHVFGYISLEDPLDDVIPTKATFRNLEIFSQLTSLAIENYYRFSNLEKRNRRLKQVLVTSNIFKLYLSLNELLKEVVWSIKFSLEFNLVSLILISKKSGQLETKAVACDDKIKLLQVGELKYDLKEYGELLKDQYKRGKSYLVTKEEPVLKHFKQIYYGTHSNGHYTDGWPHYALLLVPIKSREGKIIGFIMVDDPQDCRLPNTESMNILEILANQVAIAIDNRMLYVQAKEQVQQSLPETEKPVDKKEGEREEEDKGDTMNPGSLKRLVDRFLR
ncbi:MAG TPA: PAS domain-containing protein [bacterium]|nr:PAS domain-containing protein [bacterium]